MGKNSVCPKHKTELTLRNEQLDFAGSVYNVVVGNCPKCSVRYVNRQIMGCMKITVSNQRYEYLSGMPNKVNNNQQSTFEASHDDMKDIENYFLNSEREIIRDDISRLQKENSALKSKVKELNGVIISIEQKYKDQVGNLKNKYTTQIMLEKNEIKKEKAKFIKEHEKRVKRLQEKYAEEKYEMNKHFEDLARRFEAAQKQISVLQSKNHTLSQRVDMYIKELEEAKEISKPVLFVDEKLYVCGGTIRCEKYNHAREDVTGIIDTITGTAITMTVCRCNNCKLYYVKDAVFESYRSRYGTLLGQFVRQEDGMELGRPSSFGELAAESVLHMNGYNVGQAQNLSALDRRKILAYIIESHIMTKQEIRSHLTYLIKMNQSTPNKNTAVERWKSDVNWVNDYHSGGQDLVWLSGTAMYKQRHRK